MTAVRRPTLYLLPGLLCDGSIFEAQCKDLADVCDVRCPDFRGLDSIDAMARRVLADAPERFALAGFSMGGRVALQITHLAPQRVERLCLFDTGVKPETPDGAHKRRALVDLAYLEGMRALAAAWLPGMLAPANRSNRIITEPLVEMICRFTPDDHAGQVRALVERPDARPLLPRIKSPTFVFCGALDEWAPPALHLEIASAIAGAEFRIIADAGHFVSVEQPEAFTHSLRPFMAAGAAPDVSAS